MCSQNLKLKQVLVMLPAPFCCALKALILATGPAIWAIRKRKEIVL
jgi:hypothetical protein